ncbi:hypothetical protein [Gordonia hongkongensis]|uniref:hypothetical protein n=1 Tax=Gordonia hongkongensis TaxID=1701090 RepID=UPI003D70BDD1
MSDQELSHEDALSALADVRRECASYRTKLREAESKIADLETAATEAAQFNEARESARQRQYLEEHTDLPLWAIENRCAIADLYNEDGSLDVDPLRSVESELKSELPQSKSRPSRLVSGAHRPDSSTADEPTWADLVNRD